MQQKKNRKAKHRQGIEFDAKTNLNIRCNLKYYLTSDARSYIRVRASHVCWINFQPTNHLDKSHSKLCLPLQRTGTFASNNYNNPYNSLTNSNSIRCLLFWSMQVKITN
jgi:hypothetical protein